MGRAYKDVLLSEERIAIVRVYSDILELPENDDEYQQAAWELVDSYDWDSRWEESEILTTGEENEV